ncbi:MAG: ABC transporter ATP-binding protein [Planctomycetaceae bacterium]
MKDATILVEGVSKKFRLGAAPIDGLFAERLHRFVTAPWRMIRSSAMQSQPTIAMGGMTEEESISQSENGSESIHRDSSTNASTSHLPDTLLPRRHQAPDDEVLTSELQSSDQEGIASSADLVNPLDADAMAMHETTLWALQDINFEVSAGEVIGLIGGNGAGKSTLLKILTRITRPTSGRVGIAGRVGSLLEVGTGFHPELTGRENVFLNGAILGMTKGEIKGKFDEIVAFAGIERFLDTPVKRYSSGMHTRLAFSVAAHLEPEVLLVDEVLAVGDAKFQARCLDKMGQVSKSGRTIVFVSHNMRAIRTLCTRVLLLKSGRLVQDGTTDDVVNYYEAEVGSERREHYWSPDSVPGDMALQLLGAKIKGVPTETRISPQMSFEVSVLVNSSIPHQQVTVVLQFCDAGRALRFVTTAAPVELDCRRHEFCCQIPGRLLNDGVHLIDVLLYRDGTVPVVSKGGVLNLDIVPDTGLNGITRQVAGAVRPLLDWVHTPVT